MPLPVLICADPTPPAMDCQTTKIFGAPKGTLGRNNTNITAIAIHGVQDTSDGLLAKMCNGSTKMPVGCHVSFHYVIDGDNGHVTQVVPETDLAWAFQPYLTNFPVTSPTDCCPCPPPCPSPPCPPGLDCVETTYPGWTTQSALHPNLSADFYAINIAVTNPGRPEQSILDNTACCITPYGINQVAYDALVRLVAWIQSRYPAIQLNSQYIAFHDQIVVRDEYCLEFPCGPVGVCFTCDVSNYCEVCANRMDPTLSITEANVQYVYVETTGGCRAKITLDNFKELLGIE